MDIYTLYQIILMVFVFIFGAVIGSFLNVVIYRTPKHESIVNGSSHCMTCNTPIKWYDLFPIFSWLFLRGKCRNCKAKITPRYMLVESLTGCLFLSAYLLQGITVNFFITIVFFAVLVVISFIDFDTFEVPYWCTATIALLGIVSAFTDPTIEWWQRLLGGVVISLPFGLMAIFGGMGGGDVQLMAAAGLLLGWKIVPAAAVGVICGAIYGIIFKARNKKCEKEKNELLRTIFDEWYENLCKEEKGIKPSSKDIIIGSIEKGKAKIEWDMFEEKSWDSVPKDEALEEKLSDAFSDQDECVFKIEVNNKEIVKTKYAQRIVFGPFLSVGLVVGMLFGQQIIHWYISLI